MAKDRTEVPEASGQRNRNRCDWHVSSGGQCFLAGNEPRGQERYCDWHHFCLLRGVRAEDWNEFARYHEHAKGYCCELTHWPIDLLWKAAQGLQDLRLADRRACSLAWCRHRMVFVEFPKPPGKLAISTGPEQREELG